VAGSSYGPSLCIVAHQQAVMCDLQVRRTSEEPAEPEAWVNAFVGRIFWDFLGEKYWADVVSKKIQMKLSKIRVGSLTIRNM